MSYPVTNTLYLIPLYSQLQKISLVFKPIQSTFNYLTVNMNTAFWNMIKLEGAGYSNSLGGVYLVNNCFWKNGYEIYSAHTRNFTFPVESKNGYLAYSSAPFLKRESSLSMYTGLICEYFSNRSLISEIRIPTYEHCKINLNDMCGNLTQFQRIIPEYELLRSQIELLEKDINDHGGNYHFISNTVFWSILTSITLCTTGWLMYLGYSNLKNRKNLQVKMEHFQNNPLQLDTREVENMRNIVDYLNQIMPWDGLISMEEDMAPSFINKLKNCREKMNPHFHFFKFCKSTLPKELTYIIMEHVYPPDTSKSIKIGN